MGRGSDEVAPWKNRVSDIIPKCPICPLSLLIHRVYLIRATTGNRISSRQIRKSQTSQRTKRPRRRRNSAREERFPSNRDSSTRSRKKLCPENGRRSIALYRKVYMTEEGLSYSTLGRKNSSTTLLFCFIRGRQTHPPPFSFVPSVASKLIYHPSLLFPP